MGYENRSLKATCPHCNRSICWYWNPGQNYPSPTGWDCRGCGYSNSIAPPPTWPEIPRTLYLGHELNHQLKIHPIPPRIAADAASAQPYSIRSFLHQASRQLGGCSFGSVGQGKVMDEPVFKDICNAPDAGDWPETWDCHITAGFTRAERSCPLWERIANLCQSESEKQFLYRYLSYTKHRQFPMLLPQARIGIAERKRPDFVAFVPLQYWKYESIAIQLDGAHGAEQTKLDRQRDAYLEEQGYEVISIRPADGSSFMLEDVRRLVERFETSMNLWQENFWAVAIETDVTSSDKEIPF